MAAFIALIFLFGGVLNSPNDINLNKELHGAAIEKINTQEEQLQMNETIDLNNPDIIIVYPN